jgi:hypothetical protein
MAHGKNIESWFVKLMQMLPLAFSNKRFAQSVHKYPQSFSQITLALISRCS